MSWQESGTEYAEAVMHVPTPLEKQVGVWVLTSGHNRAKPTYKVGPRYFNYYSLHVIISGELLLSFRGNQVILRSGDILCMHPDETYEYQINPNTTNLQMVWSAFNGPLASIQLQQTQLSATLPYVRSGDSRQLINMMHTIRELISHQLEKNLLLTAKVLEFLHLLVEATISPEPRISTEFPIWLERGKLYMDTHFSEGITVEHVADSLGISRSHFSKMFHRHFGTVPAHYLRSLRMQEAQKRLTETSYTATQIALSLGYGDLFSFTRTFTQYYGLSPKHYRMAHILSPS